MPGEHGNIFLLAVSSAKDGKNLVCKRHNTASGRLVSADIDEVLSSVERMRRENPTEDELQLEGRGVPSGLKVYVGCDSSFTYSVVVDKGYPDRHGYGMLREFVRQIAGDFGGVLRGTKKKGGATGKVEGVTSGLLDKYDDLANVDKVAALQVEVEAVKSRMNDNVQAQFANMANADELEEKTSLMRDTASDFKSGSSKLRKKMWWKNAKLNVCLLLIVVGVALALWFGLIPETITDAVPVVGR